MENGLGCHSLKMPALSQATSNGSSTNGNTTTSSELFCQINDPEDVGAIVTSFCKVIQDGYGQIKKEIVTENEAVLGKKIFGGIFRRRKKKEDKKGKLSYNFCLKTNRCI